MSWLVCVKQHQARLPYNRRWFQTSIRRKHSIWPQNLRPINTQTESPAKTWVAVQTLFRPRELQRSNPQQTRTASAFSLTSTANQFRQPRHQSTKRASAPPFYESTQWPPLITRSSCKRKATLSCLWAIFHSPSLFMELFKKYASSSNTARLLRSNTTSTPKKRR